MDITQFLANLKTPKLFRDIITVIGGLGFLFIIWEFKLKYLNLNLNISIGHLEIDFAILLLSYLTGKALLYFTQILYWLDEMINYSLSQKPTPKIKFKERIKTYFGYKNIANHPFNLLDSTLSSHEIWKGLSEYELYEENKERDIQTGIFARFFIIYAICGCFYFQSFIAKLISFILIIFFLFFWYDHQRSSFLSWIEFQKGIARKKYEETRKDKLSSIK